MAKMFEGAFKVATFTPASLLEARQGCYLSSKEACLAADRRAGLAVIKVVIKARVKCILKVSTTENHGEGRLQWVLW